MKKKALISVSDKSGVVEFARALQELGYEIISTGGTQKILTEAGVMVMNISDITGFPECLDGRIKTLHPKVHGGLLAVRDNAEHCARVEELGIEYIDIVAVNLYPFKAAIRKAGVTLDEVIENIDIGGPAMVRSAAKNSRFVTALTNPADYDGVIEELRANGATSEQTRFRLMAKAFRHTAAYDALIAEYFARKAGLEKFPQELTLTFEKAQELRYGENPHQQAAYYREISPPAGSIATARQIHGKELSYNNIGDASAALELLREFSEPCVVAVKHANPCGVGVAEQLLAAYNKAYACDSISIFGGIVAVNREVDAQTAAEMNKIFLEIVIAPAFSKEALEILTAKKNLRLMLLPEIAAQADTGYDLKKVGGGLLIQDSDAECGCELQNVAENILPDGWNCVTQKQPTRQQLRELQFGWKVVKHVKSNAIVIAKDGAAIGVGPGQTNRIWSARMALERSGESSAAVLASDAFFPFPDVVEEAAKHGIAAIIQPGGSLKDEESIKKCDESGIAMIFTGKRHFKH